MTIKKIVGLYLLSLEFAIIIVLSILSYGFMDALVVWGVSLILGNIFILGLHLLEGANTKKRKENKECK